MTVTPTNGKKHILVIEDSPDDALLIERALKMEGALEFADSGTEGIRKATSGHWDAVILDYKLGDLTGSEVMLQLREKKSEIPVIVTSGMGSHFIVARSLALGAREFVSKDAPDFSQKLTQALHSILSSPDSRLSEAVPSEAAAKTEVAARAQEIKRIINSILADSDLVSTLGIVGPDGALIHGHVQDKSGAQDVTAVLSGTVQLMLSTVASHLGYGSARSFVASYEKGSIAMAPLPGNLVLFLTSSAGPSEIEKLRAELEAASGELALLIRVKK